MKIQHRRIRLFRGIDCPQLKCRNVDDNRLLPGRHFWQPAQTLHRQTDFGRPFRRIHRVFNVAFFMRFFCRLIHRDVLRRCQRGA